MKKLLMVGAIAVLSTGCATQNYVLSEGGQAAPTQSEWQHFFVGGIGQEKIQNAAQVCGGANKVAKVQTQTTFLNGLANAVGQGIYTPRQSNIYCK
ncbi:Bor family protein [Moraxella nasicaprae]|uniref:Bor family protein n=2 Tax=Moraxella TaxID=475 RepID=A0ABY6F744_9GAMM|nr:Bor family protein [Moraxella nasicaprae]UXZ05690.1 Bor family protein [Moraxella nasicaprae]